MPIALSDLYTDRLAVLDGATFSVLWREPGRLDWMLATLGIWRREYRPVYIAQHTAYNTTLSAIVEKIDATTLEAAALDRLNGLRRLGPPLATPALSQFKEIERLYACSMDSGKLRLALEAAPLCPECTFHLGEEAPVADARRVTRAIERGMQGQQQRLAQRIVSQLLSRPVAGSEERLSRFIEVVQASDLSGLALALDDELVDFLSSLLEANDYRSIFEQLADAYPRITQENVDDAVGEFRRLLHDELAGGVRSVRLGFGEGL